MNKKERKKFNIIQFIEITRYVSVGIYRQNLTKKGSWLQL